MPFPKKNKVQCVCKHCRGTKFVLPYKVKTFKYCSNKCKWEVKKKQIPANKLHISRRIFAKCQNPLCEKGRYIRPSDHKLGRFKYCSHFCRNYIKSKKFLQQLEVRKERDSQQQKRNIWFLK